MRNALTFCLAVLTVVLLFIDPASAGFSALGTVASYGFSDGNLTKTRALPTGASAVTSEGIDLGEGGTGTFVTACEFLLEAPALLTGVLGDAATIKYDVITSANSDMSSPVTLQTTILTQTGAGGAGCAAATKRFRVPTDTLRYVAVKATKSSAGDASASSFILSLKF
jgi:hypothetical protein